MFIIFDASIKNNVATTLIFKENITLKTVYHAMNVSSTEAKLFAIRCDISQVLYTRDIKQIIIVTNAIHMAKKIFDSSNYLY